MLEKKGNIIYISHGGGPMPVLGDHSHRKMVQFLKGLSEKLPRPDEVLVISAHWESEVPTIYNAANQKLLFDYFGFPAESYEIEYPTKENGDLVSLIESSFKEKNIDYKIDTTRGIDHGVFIPLMLMYPDGNLPVTQLSLVKGLNPKTHIELGKALQS
ncbi:MAG: class III extradiol ring-cleavage dioxygenase, partial [Spirochaetales bacterium]|nr:class III extradiol ring-cleavage dioxygenase [Spirochaetales bacterium]